MRLSRFRPILRALGWPLAALVVALITLGVLFAPQVLEAAEPGAPDTVRPGADEVATFPPDIQIFNQDYILASGQEVNESVAVFRGDVRIEAGARLRGDLSVFGGDADIAGEVIGDVAVVGGDLRLRSTARVDGDVSVMGGEAIREPGAVVTGNFVGGFQVEPGQITPPLDNRVTGADGPGRSPLLRLLWRLVQAVLWTLFVAGLVVLGSWLLPDALDRYVAVVRAEPGLSLVLGLVVNLAAGVVAGILIVTLCLAPVGLVVFGAMALLNLVGWAVVVHWAGQALLRTLSTDGVRYHPLVGVALAGLLLTGVVALAWALVPCLGWVLGGLVSSLGVGSILVDLSRGRGLLAGRSPAGGEGPQGKEGPTASPPAPMTPGPGEGPTPAEPSPPTAVVPEKPRPQAVESEQVDDFTRIRGVGPTFARRLQEAGITRYAQLAAMTPEEVAAVIGWSPARVVRDQILEQAAALAQEGSAQDTGF